MLKILRKTALVLCAAMVLLSLAAWVSGRWCRVLVGWAGWQDKNAGVWRTFGVDSSKSALTFYYMRSWSRSMLVLDPREIGPQSAEFVKNARPQLVFVYRGYPVDSTHTFYIWRVGGGGMPLDATFIAVPPRALAIAPGILVYLHLRRRWRLRYRRNHGLCLNCGYDLRASTICFPECGTSVPQGHVARIGEG